MMTSLWYEQVVRILLEFVSARKKHNKEGDCGQSLGMHFEDAPSRNSDHYGFLLAFSEPTDFEKKSSD